MWLDTAKEIINELENISIEDYQTKMQRQKKKKDIISENYGTITREAI